MDERSQRGRSKIFYPGLARPRRDSCHNFGKALQIIELPGLSHVQLGEEV